MRIRCSQCGKSVKIPADYKQKRGKCPACHAVIIIPPGKKTREGGAVSKQISGRQKKRITIPHDIHPLVYLIGKHKDSIARYGLDLQKIYELIKKQYVHREEYEKQKLILKKQVFNPIIDDAVKLPDFSMPVQDRISLWKLVFTLLPYTYKDKDPEVTYNIYQRYDLAALVCLSYILAGINDVKVKKAIMRKGVRGERNTPKMKQLFKDIIGSDYGGEFTVRIKKTIEETQLIKVDIPDGKEREYRQIEEDFSFGFSWAAFHLTSSAPKSASSH